MSTGHIRGFGEPGCRDAREVGGKAAGLAELVAAGLPVAPGFVVGASAYREFLAGSSAVVAAALAGPSGGDGYAAVAERLERHLADVPVPAAVDAEIRDRYRRLCAETGVDRVPVAVRSSATAEDSAAASFAGEFETWVDIAGAEAVVDHVHRCWRSVFTARAIAYARGRGIDPAAVEMAVVVQKTVRARAAGVMFTISPVTGDRSRIAIEASWGLGLSVVGGEVTPDRWVVDKVGLAVVSRTPGDKRVEYRRGDTAVAVDPDRWARLCLTDTEVLALAALGRRIERERGCPQDIEFAVDADPGTGDGLVLLQQRPETVWSSRPHVPRFAAGEGLARWISGAVTGGGGQTRSIAPTGGHSHEATV